MEKVNKLPTKEKIMAAQRRRRTEKPVRVFLSLLVAAATLSALTLPAVTLGRPNCGEKEHIHDDECYTEMQVLSCTYESLGIHRHTQGCYDSEGNITCHYGDFVLHTHDSTCYDAEGKLVCTLPEIRAHIHEDSCYAPRRGCDFGSGSYPL